MLKRKTLLAAAIAIACSASFSSHGAEGSRNLDIPAGDLTIALESLARQAGIELVYRMDQVNGLKTQGVSGELSLQEAVQKLLENTDLELRVDPSGAMLIAAPGRTDKSAANAGGDGTRASEARAISDEHKFQIAQATHATEAEGSVRSEQQMSWPTEKEDIEALGRQREALEEIVVTGTNIRNVEQRFSPIITVTREELDRAGYERVSDFLQDLPQNFGGGVSPDRVVGGSAGVGSASVNLRGLGAEASLVLLNGRRLAPAGLYGDYVDIAAIPTSALDRVDVLTDGASAIYGSDAVAGVTNFVLRKELYGGGNSRPVRRAE